MLAGVIISREGDGGDTSFFSKNYLQTPPNKNVMEVLARVVPMFDNTFIISKCGERVQKKTLTWLDYHDFFLKTGINEDCVYFCKTRPEKAGIAKQLGITHYIDDRKDILSSMIDVVPFLFLFGGTGLYKGFDTLPSWSTFEQKLNRLDRWSKV